MTGSGSGEESLMFSPELERWSHDIEASVLDSHMRERLVSVDSMWDAIAKLRVFLDEAWAQLGPSFLQVAANYALTGDHLEAQYQEKGLFCEIIMMMIMLNPFDRKYYL